MENHEYLNNNEALELKNGRFLDVIKGKYYPKGTRLLLIQGRIVEVVKENEEFKLGKPQRYIDLQGKVVMPTLFNTHCHIQLNIPYIGCSTKDLYKSIEHRVEQIEKSMEDCISRGITNIRDAWSEDLGLNKHLKQRIDKGEILGPRIYESVIISPLGGTFAPKIKFFEKLVLSLSGNKYLNYNDPLCGVIAFSEEAKEEHISHAVDVAFYERGANYIKIYDQKEKRISYKKGAKIMSLPQLCSIVEQCNLRGIKCTMHQLTLESFKRALEAGVHSIAHLPSDGELSNKDIEKFISKGMIIEPTVSALYYLCFRHSLNSKSYSANLERLEEYRKNTYYNLEDFWIEPLKESFNKGIYKSKKGTMRFMGIKSMDRIFKYYANEVYYGIDNLKKLYKKGAIIACGNDAGPVPATEAMVCQEIDMLHEFLKGGYYNILPKELIKIATINSAEVLAIERDFGSIEQGKVADLIVLEGDVLKDHKLIGSEVDALFMEGKIVINNCNLKIQSCGFL